MHTSTPWKRRAGWLGILATAGLCIDLLSAQSDGGTLAGALISVMLSLLAFGWVQYMARRDSAYYTNIYKSYSEYACVGAGIFGASLQVMSSQETLQLSLAMGLIGYFFSSSLMILFRR